MYLALQELATNGVFEIFTGDQRNKLVKQTNSSDSTTTKSLQELERLGLITIWKQSTKKQQPGYKTVFITYNFNMGEDLLVDCDKEEIRLNKKYHRNLQRKSDKVLRKKINEGNLDIPIPYFNS
jgi:predicted transcriptional regulator